MRTVSRFLLLTSSLMLSACGQMGQQWFDPDKTFALFDQPTIKGVNDTQEDMAKEAMNAGDFSRAADFYQQLVSSGKGTPEQVLRYKYSWAESLRRVGNNEPALAMFEELHSQNPTNLDVAEGRGLCLMAAGKVEDAGRAFAEVLEKDAKRWRTLNALGILFVSKNLIPEAIAYYTEALNQSPDNPAVLNNVGLSLAIDRQFPRAEEALQQAARLSKSPAQKKHITLNLAMVYGTAGDLDTARDIAARYLEGAALDNNLGLYAYLAKDVTLAKSYLNMALSQSNAYYERAWENLDLVSEAGGGAAPGLPPADAPKVTRPGAKLPSIEALKHPREGAAAAPRPPAASVGAKPVKPSTAPVAVEPAIPVPPVAEKPDAAPMSGGKKPAGLVVGPGEGD